MAHDHVRSSIVPRSPSVGHEYTVTRVPTAALALTVADGHDGGGRLDLLGTARHSDDTIYIAKHQPILLVPCRHRAKDVPLSQTVYLLLHGASLR